MRSGLKEKTLNALNRSTAVKPVDHATANPVVFAASPAAAAVAAPVAAVVQPPPTISFTSPTAAVSSSYAKEKLFKLGDPTLPPGWKNRLNSQGRENFRSDLHKVWKCFWQLFVLGLLRRIKLAVRVWPKLTQMFSK